MVTKSRRDWRDTRNFFFSPDLVGMEKTCLTMENVFCFFLKIQKL